jgi:hypothetical protein
MLKRVVLAMNIEVDDVNNKIRNGVNNWHVDNFIQFCMEDAYFLDIITKNLIKHNYPKDVVEAFKSGDYKYVFESFKDESSYLKFFDEAFHDMNRFIFLKYEADTYLDRPLEGYVILPIAYSGNRPPVPHTYIGWVTPHNINHLLNHEHLTEEAAHLFQDSYSTFLRQRKDEFDVFFDGSSAEEVIEYIRTL